MQVGFQLSTTAMRIIMVIERTSRMIVVMMPLFNHGCKLSHLCFTVRELLYRF
jgi:hypothetical protein